jgi:hypothetical protein
LLVSTVTVSALAGAPLGALAAAAAAGTSGTGRLSGWCGHVNAALLWNLLFVCLCCCFFREGGCVSESSGAESERARRGETNNQTKQNKKQSSNQQSQLTGASRGCGGARRPRSPALCTA